MPGTRRTPQRSSWARDLSIVFLTDRQAVKAGVQAVDPATAGPEREAALLAQCRAELASYKRPRTVDFFEELPRDDNGATDLGPVGGVYGGAVR